MKEEGFSVFYEQRCFYKFLKKDSSENFCSARNLTRYSPIELMTVYALNSYLKANKFEQNSVVSSKNKQK